MQSGSEPKQPQLGAAPCPLGLPNSCRSCSVPKSWPGVRRYRQPAADLLANPRCVRQQLAAWLGCRRDLPLLAPPAITPSSLMAGHVSWSHSGEQLLLGWSPQPVGVDLEPADRPIRAESLWQRLCPDEPPAALANAVLQRWVALEALTKRRRSSIAAELGRWSWQLEHGKLASP